MYFLKKYLKQAFSENWGEIDIPLKRILISRHYAIFLLLGIGIYVSLLIFYTFQTLFFTGLIYLLLIPISIIHYRRKNKKAFSSVYEEDEDVL